MGDHLEQRDEGLGNRLVCPDDQRILALLKASGETPEESARIKLHNDVLGILKSSAEGYAAKAKSRIKRILTEPFLKASDGVETLYENAVANFVRNIQEGKFRYESSLSTYLCGIATKITLNECRRIKACMNKKAPENTIPDHAQANEPDGPNPLFAKIMQAIDLLKNEETAKIMKLYYGKELKDREIAEQLKRHWEPLEKVRQRVKKKRQRALKKLRDQFGGQA